MKMNDRFRFSILMLALVGVAFTGAPATAEPLVWRWSNPNAHGNNIAAMAHHNGWVVQVGERGQLYVSRTLDEWIPRDTGVTNALRSVTFFGEQLVVTAENGLILVAPSVDPIHRFDPIQLPTSDWLEGIAASPNLLVAVGDNGAIYTSDNAAVWQRRPQPFNTWLRSVAFGNSRFVAVGENGFIASSSDGASWQVHNSGITEHLNRVAWAHNQFVAVGESGRLLVSADGAAWKSSAPVNSNHLNTAAGHPSGLLVAGDQELRINEQNAWTDQIRSSSLFPAPNWTYLSSVWDGTLFLVGGRSGRLIEGFKTNAASATVWVERRPSVRSWLWDLFRAQDFYIAAGDRATVMTSDDGIRWELEVVPDSYTNAVFLGVGGTNGRYFIVGNQGRAITSANGVVWEPLPLATDNDLQGVVAGPGRFIITGGNGTILTSTDGSRWTRATSGTTAFLSSATSFPGGYIASGSSGTILKSSDGISWSRVNSGTTQWIYRVRYLNSQLIAVGQNGTILTSTDGNSWAPRSSGTTKWLNDVTYLAGAYYIAGTQGTCLRSSDSVAWRSIGTITEKSLFALANDGTQLIAAGVEGAIVRTRVIPDRTPIAIHSIAHRDGQALLLFSGNPDQRFTLDRSPNLSRWATGSQLEFIDGATTLLHIENTGAVDTQFYRPTLRAN